MLSFDANFRYYSKIRSTKFEICFLRMRILGIDPGIGRMGWGIVEGQKGKVHSIAFDCLQTSSKEEPLKRLLAVHTQVENLIKEYKPDVMAIEELFFNKNVTTAFSVGQARGVILLAAVQNNIPVTSYTPLAIKSAVTGYGKAEKKQVGQMVKLLLHLPKVPTPDDTADALAVAITHAVTLKYV